MNNVDLTFTLLVRLYCFSFHVQRKSQYVNHEQVKAVSTVSKVKMVTSDKVNTMITEYLVRWLR